VVLGCRVRPDGTPSTQLRRRVALAVALYDAGAAPRLLLSGGGEPVSEAQVMADLATTAGVPTDALFCEATSRNTAENALYSASLLRELGLSRVVLVSSRAHLPRARWLFRLAGLRVVGSAGVPARSARRALVSIVIEIVALPRSVWRVLRPRGITAPESRRRPAACGR
jgi:SanA protein